MAAKSGVHCAGCKQKAAVEPVESANGYYTTNQRPLSHKKHVPLPGTVEAATALQALQVTLTQVQ
jgi:hypothetical protein